MSKYTIVSLSPDDFNDFFTKLDNGEIIIDGSSADMEEVERLMAEELASRNSKG